MANQAAILTVGDKYVSGQVKDESGDALAGILNKLGWNLVGRSVVGDDEEQVAIQMAQLADSGQVDVVFTIDAVGILPTDRCAEAMYRVCEKWVTGLSEMVRFKLFDKTPAMALYRGLAGIRGKTLIVNLPGTPIAVRDTMDVLKVPIRLIIEQMKPPVA
jgi:molybdenum cofactor synthesis domain-containing protein